MASAIRVRLPPLNGIFPRSIQRNVRRYQGVDLYRQATFLGPASRFNDTNETIRTSTQVGCLFFPLFIFEFQRLVPVRWGYRDSVSFGLLCGAFTPCTR